MFSAFIKAIVFTGGLSGFYIMFVTYRQIWRVRPDYQADRLERKRQTQLRAIAYKEKYGSVIFVTAVFLWGLASCSLLFFGPLMACWVFSGRHLTMAEEASKIFSAFGLFLLTYQMNWRFIRLYM